jgi:hypothetical protein
MSTPTKKAKPSKPSASASPSFQNILAKENYYIIGAGILLLIIGYILMSGGHQPADQFNDEEIYSFRRITLSPIIVISGYIAIGVGIMYRKKSESK